LKRGESAPGYARSRLPSKPLPEQIWKKRIGNYARLIHSRLQINRLKSLIKIRRAGRIICIEN